MNKLAAFLNGKTKTQLIELVTDLAKQHEEVAQDLLDRNLVKSGKTDALVERVRQEIQDVGAESGWRDYWNDRGYTPDYSGVQNKLEMLLNAGLADEVLALGEKLLDVGVRQVEESHDHGETAMQVADCVPVIVKALTQSSLESPQKLAWAVEHVLKDDFGICDALVEYLHKPHAKTAWHVLAEQLLKQLAASSHTERIDDYSRDYGRDQLSNWCIHSLERAGRKNEVIPLCEGEAEKTGSYARLVARLLAARRHEDAERWIRKGVAAIEQRWPGIAADLRAKLRELRARKKDWPSLGAMHAEEFVRRPSRECFTDCQNSSGKIGVWSDVRVSLLTFLESGRRPWEQNGWPLPPTGLDAPKSGSRRSFPMVEDLIDIAILENKPDKVLHWYDQLPEQRFGWAGVDENEIATAVQTHAPERAVAIWKTMAERLIDRVKPHAYKEAARYLRKGAKIMAREGKQAVWDRYLQQLREEHFRKRRLIEILDDMGGEPAVRSGHR